MKFKYDKTRGEPVAYIDCDGDLNIKGQPTGRDNVCLCQGGAVFASDFTPDDPTNRRVFCAGDSITITF